MIDDKKYILLGSGGHAKVLYEILSIRGLAVNGIIAPQKPADTFWQALEYLGDDRQFNLSPEQCYLVNTLGSIKDTQPREILYQSYKLKNYNFPAIIHPSAIISRSAVIAQSVQLLSGVIINSCAIIEENSIINSGVIIEHDCHIGAHNHIAPGAVLCGQVKIASNVHIGTGAIINQGICIGKNAVIAAGAVVISNVAENTLFAGVPAVEKKKLS